MKLLNKQVLNSSEFYFIKRKMLKHNNIEYNKYDSNNYIKNNYNFQFLFNGAIFSRVTLVYFGDPKNSVEYPSRDPTNSIRRLKGK